jgi:DNA invertase Pin-like site-specific DNA recombinase
MKAAIFVRVSKKEQDYQRQLSDLRNVAEFMGATIIAEFAEKIGGTTPNKQRNSLQELLVLARTGKIDKILVQEVSRLGRSTVEVLKVVEELTQLEE